MTASITFLLLSVVLVAPFGVVAAIAAVLNPAQTDALYMVADGTGGHAFATTLQEHNANVEKWYLVRKEKGDF